MIMMMLAKPNLVILDGGVQYLLRWQLLEVDDTQKPLLVILQTSYSSWQFVIRQEIVHFSLRRKKFKCCISWTQFHFEFESTL